MLEIRFKYQCHKRSTVQFTYIGNVILVPEPCQNMVKICVTEKLYIPLNLTIL